MNARQVLLTRTLSALRAVVAEYGEERRSRSFLYHSENVSNPRPFAVSRRTTTDQLDSWLCLALDDAGQWRVHAERDVVILTSPSGRLHRLSMKVGAPKRVKPDPIAVAFDRILKGDFA